MSATSSSDTETAGPDNPVRSALDELAELRRALAQIRQEKEDLEIALTTTMEHGDAIEAELSETNQRLGQEVAERQKTEARLQRLVEVISRQKQDLEIALTTAIEHGDAIEEQFLTMNAQLSQEIGERRAAEARLEDLVSAVSRQKEDLEVLVETIAAHGDEIDAQLREQLAVVEEHSRLDALTDIANRRRFEEELEAEWRRCARKGVALGVVMCDVDLFKPYNDSLGHQAGDRCLAAVAQGLKTLTRRPGDLVARYGGEEFVLLLPEIDAAGLAAIAARAVAVVRGLAVGHPRSPFGVVTLSAGAALAMPDGGGDAAAMTASMAALLRSADRNLYLAKERGRDQAVSNPANLEPTMQEKVDVYGEFIGIDTRPRGEYLRLGFQPSSVPLKQRWRNNGLSADFLGDYVTTFIPKADDDPKSGMRQAEVRSAVSYIANELLENAMKYSDEALQEPISINLLLEEDRIIIAETNTVGRDQAEGYRAFVQKLLDSDPMELYVEQLEAKAGDGAGSGLGFLTMMNDYGAELAWRFVTAPSGLVVTVTTEVYYPIQ
ncbi:MAG: DUF6272 family protein [Chromatiales bacterium]|jgi:diguanylate cyclase (GGDEF)-like protein|nr:DUF6272 family protein [Chromatiales bacterium]MDX9765964.1 DUF6272 family protein [Ectothiorhodospiraceae bacterium]